MDDSEAPWVQRLRAGEPPRRWPLVVGVVVLTIAGLLIAVLEVTHPHDVARFNGSQAALSVVIVPVILVVAGPVIAIGALVRGRQDRRILARIGPSEHPALFLPVSTYAIRKDDMLPSPRPILWTVDAVGLHAWAPGADSPVLEAPWSRVRGIDVATEWQQGTRQTYGIWVDLDDGHLVLRPRRSLGRPFDATRGQTEVLMRVLRSVRQEVDRSADATGSTPK